MYQKNQKLVIREDNKESLVLVEDIISGERGQMLKVKDAATGVVRVVNPVEQNIVEHLED